MGFCIIFYKHNGTISVHAKKSTICSSKQILLRVSPGPDDSSIDKFNDLVAYKGILHVVLQRARVRLRLLQDLLHHGVTHDCLRKIR